MKKAVIITLLSVDSEKRNSLGFFNFSFMERVLENVLVIFDAVENHLVEKNFAVLVFVGAGDSQWPG